MTKRSFLVNVLVECEDTDDWSEGADETFAIARAINAQENGAHILSYSEVNNDVYPKYEVLTEEGGV